MIEITPLRCPIQSYAWGSRTTLAELQGRPSPAAEPEAELWMGAHPKAPAEIFEGDRWRSLRDVIAAAPAEVLGPRVAGRFAGELPFLFKALAAGEPLSIQAHPDARQAKEGFRREDALGIARDAPERNYRDPHHKPELLRAVSPFAMLRGFRAPAEISALLEQADLPAILPEHEALRDPDPARALESFFSACMALPAERVEEIAARAASDPVPESPAARRALRWVGELAKRYPGDRGVLSPLLLHCFKLAPGEAVFTGPGVLHAYLDGVGIELMANSDNVLRGGLTRKHVDLPELCKVLRFEPQAPQVLSPVEVAAGVRRFETAAEEFVLEELAVDRPGCELAAGVAILLCTGGEGEIVGRRTVRFGKGDVLLVPAAAGRVRLAGSASLFRATVGER